MPRRFCEQRADKISNAFARYRPARFRLPFRRELVVNFVSIGEAIRAQYGLIQSRLLNHIGEGAVGAQYLAQQLVVNADGSDGNHAAHAGGLHCGDDICAHRCQIACQIDVHNVLPLHGAGCGG